MDVAILFHDVRVIDGRSAEPMVGMDVLVEGDRIVSVATSGPLPPAAAGSPEPLTVIEGAGRTLLPGLIDCHAHYPLDPRATVLFEQEEREPDARVVLRAAGRAREALEAGVTSARSAGAPRGLDIPLAAAIEATEVAGPRLLPAGPAITITGGHGRRFGREADGEPALRVAVRANVRDGARVIKAIASEAAMLTTSVAGVQELTEPELRAIVEEAARLRCRVLAHAQGKDAVVAAARAGVASIEHAFLADEATLEVVARSGAVLVPTLVVTDVWRTLPVSPAQRERQTQLERLHRASCETAVRLGIPMATGTDTGVTGVLPGMVAREIALLHDHGLSALDAIRAGTSAAARLLGTDADVGTIEAGKLADLVLVDGDPVADLGRLEHPLMVMQGGHSVLDGLAA
jgi:imidazolonepropionase-like amidohydrolase